MGQLNTVITNAPWCNIKNNPDVWFDYFWERNKTYLKIDLKAPKWTLPLNHLFQDIKKIRQSHKVF